ncbi:MAG: large-conductance mechanosensitive channel protein MscL [Xanthomonadales bacterium]|nr:large-conductance mechanosensitive channel protein MscL [Xanthomonadales bacterium]HET9047408.1 large-conductance mechanosensitive channel protein MscL [Chiayiivirga sp.]
MSMLSEFKDFAMRGSVIDLAVGVVIGGAFGKIVSALVDKIIMPPIGLLIGGVDFSKWVITLKEASVDAAGAAVPAVTLGIGDFLNTLIQFILIAFAIFIAIKAINRLHKKAEEAPAAPPAPTADQQLLTEIRDLLKQRAG